MSHFSLLVLAFSHLVVDMYVGFMMPLLPALEEKLGVSFAALAGVVGLCGIIVNLIQPLAARFIRYFPDQLFLFIGPAISSLLALIGVVESYEAFTVLAIVSVIGTGIFHPDGVVAAHIASGEHEHLGVPIFLSGGFFGFSSGAIISSQWFMHYEFTGFWLLALPGVICSILIVSIRKNIAYEKLSESTVIRQKNHDIATKASRFHISTLVILASCLVTPVAVIYTIYSKFLEIQYGDEIAIEWSGIVLALLGLSGAAGSYLWGWISKNHSRYLLVAMTQAVATVAFLIFVTVEPGYFLIAITLILGFSWGTSIFPTIATAAKKARGLTATERAGWVVGGSWGIAGLFQVLSGVSTSYGFELTYIIKIPVVFIICALLVSLYMWRKEKSLLATV